jgi:hypothetical protein
VFPLPDTMPEASDLPQYAHLEDLVASSADHGLGQYDGNDIGDSACTVYMVTDVVAPTVRQIRKALAGAMPPKGSRIEVYRYADESSTADADPRPVLVQALP